MATWAIANLQAQIEETGATVTIQNLPPVSADDPLSRVFENLIENAIKYRREAPPDIRLSAERRGRQWLLSVQGNGIGFEMQYADQIFGVVERLHGSKIWRTGIDFAACRKLVERYGGRIWAESEPDKCSTF